MIEVIIGALVTISVSALAGAWGLGASLNRKFDSTDERLSKLEHSIEMLSSKSEFEKTLLEQRIVASLDRTNETVVDIQLNLKALHRRLDTITQCYTEDKKQ